VLRVGTPELGEPTSMVSTASTGRSTRRSREELRALVLGAGNQLILEEGLGTGAENLTFKRVFDRLEDSAGIRVTNASVIGRIWDNQRDFQTEVLSVIAHSPGSADMDKTLEALGPLLEHADRSTVDSRWHAVRQVCRVGGAANVDALIHTRSWPPWFGVWALVMAGGDTEGNRPIEEALRRGYEEVTNQWGEAYGSMLAFFGLRLRSPMTLRQLTVAAGALAEGCALRDRVDPESMRRILRPTGPDGETEEWTLFGIGLESLAALFLEADPAWEFAKVTDAPREHASTDHIW
jgi:ADP-ribose pyrophosphatase YjhB (NUDIX family)